MADNKAAQEASPKKRSGKLGLYTTMVVLIIATPFIMPTLTLCLAGMIPTLVALVTDNDRQKSSATAIGALNFAGTVPFIIDLWTKGQTMENVFHILADPSSWLIMLGAAGIGHLILFAIPQAVATLTFARTETRMKLLKENLENLKTTWGPDVATTKPLDKVERKG